MYVLCRVMRASGPARQFKYVRIVALEKIKLVALTETPVSVSVRPSRISNTGTTTNAKNSKAAP